MLSAKSVAESIKKAGVTVFTGTPCSMLTSLLDAVADDSDLTFIPAANEGEAIAVAAGAQLGGKLAMTLFQNSGLGNAVNPLTSLAIPFRIPMILLTTWRGEPHTEDEPQHGLMGRITPNLLELLQIPLEVVSATQAEFDHQLGRALVHTHNEHEPFALLLPKDVLETASQSRSSEAIPSFALESMPAPWTSDERWEQDDALDVIHGTTSENDVVIASTGYAGRALLAIGDRPNQFYLLGSMGCAAALGLGLATACPSKRIVVIDGDASLLMHLGTLATLGNAKPRNLLHVVLDNGVNDSTGGQPSLSSIADLSTAAKACGYPRVLRLPDLEELQIQLEEATDELTFLHLRTLPRAHRDLPRPHLPPFQIAERLRDWLME